MTLTFRQKIISAFFIFALLIFIILISAIPSINAFGTINKNKGQLITLTFDDGPGPETEKILDILKEKNLTATFFITCTHIDESEISLIKRMSDEKNIVAMHGYDHTIFQGTKKLEKCKIILENITGQEVLYFRPPYGFKSPNTIFAAKKLNMTTVMWSVFPKDYKADNPQEIIDFVGRHLENNSIICLHDGPAERYSTTDALPTIIDLIKDKSLINNQRSIPEHLLR